MVVVALLCGKEGELVSCEARGHANYAACGTDIVCAAVSVLLRVAVLQLNEWAALGSGLEVSVSYPARGRVEIHVLKYEKDSLHSLVCMFSFLRLGFKSLEAEYPEFLCVSVDCVELE